MTHISAFMEAAIAEARLCTKDVPVGCVIVNEHGQVIARAHNQREELLDPAGHAEILALRQGAASIGDWRLSGCTLYCTLEPCPMCAEAIIQARLAKVVFGAWDAVAGAAGSTFNLFISGRSLPVPQVIGGILEEECRQMLLDFFAQRRRKQDE